MADVIFVAVLVAFFALAALYVTWCDHIIGPDDFKPDEGADAEDSLAIKSIEPSTADQAEVTV
jgi:hypothetical protein